MAETKIFKSFVEEKSNEKFKTEFGQGVISFVSWDRLLPYIEHSVNKEMNEKVEGIKIDINGVHVKIVKNVQR